MTAPQWRRLVDDLTREIRSGQRAPGTRLPSYAELAEHGYAQSTVTRAYQEMTTQGLLVAVPGSGTYVADPVPPPIRPVPDMLADHEARIAQLEDQVRRLLADRAMSGSDQVGETT